MSAPETIFTTADGDTVTCQPIVSPKGVPLMIVTIHEKATDSSTVLMLNEANVKALKKACNTFTLGEWARGRGG